MLADDRPTEASKEIRFRGIPVSPGVVIGPLVLAAHDDFRVLPVPIREDQIEEEIARLETALVKTREQILEIREQVSKAVGEKDASIFDAHLLVVEDVTILEAVKKQLAQRLLCIDYIYHHLMNTFAQSMRETEDSYLAERASDILDVGRRVMHNLVGREQCSRLTSERPAIILAPHLAPSDTACFNRANVLGFGTDDGNKFSHVAIMARSLHIPAVVGLKDASQRVEAVDEVILDGYEGLLIIHPTEATKQQYGKVEAERSRVEQSLVSLRGTLAQTQDGRRIVVSANVELVDDLPLLEESGAEGVGLYRTEFLFLSRTTLPTEDDQVAAYRQVIEAARPHNAIIRTLDIGGDKILEDLSMGKELNPFLGWRAIRFCLEREDVFRTQLRAVIRAAGQERARILIPMVSNLDELLRTKRILGEVLEELKNQYQEAFPYPELGVMIEVPSAVLIADELAAEVDFFSIGTNDLVQYTLAVDRTNNWVSKLYQPSHPAILRLIRMTCEAANRRGIWTGVCGEMAGEILYLPLLIGLGVSELSMGSVFIPRTKRALQTLRMDEVIQLADECLAMKTASQVNERLKEVALSHYPELLI